MTSPPPIPNSSSNVVQEMLFHRPVQPKVPLARAIRELPRLLRLSPRVWADMLRATWELAIALRTLRKQPVSTLGLLQRSPAARSPDTLSADTPLTAAQHARIARVRYAIEVVAPRVPWRSDCLVQCLAGRRWLARHGVTTRIAIGVKRDEIAALHAHAWLCADGITDSIAQEIIVTGGDVSDFDEFRPSKRKLP